MNIHFSVNLIKQHKKWHKHFCMEQLRHHDLLDNHVMPIFSILGHFLKIYKLPTTEQNHITAVIFCFFNPFYMSIVTIHYYGVLRKKEGRNLSVHITSVSYKEVIINNLYIFINHHHEACPSSTPNSTKSFIGWTARP